MKRTTRAIRNSTPSLASMSGGDVQLVTMPAPPWEQPVSREEAHKAAKEGGFFVRNSYKKEGRE